MKLSLLLAFLFISVTICIPVMMIPPADTEIPSSPASTTAFATVLEARDEEDLDPPFVSPTVYTNSSSSSITFFSFSKFNSLLPSAYEVRYAGLKPPLPPLSVSWFTSICRNCRDLNKFNTFSFICISQKQDEITCNLRKKTYTQLAITSRIRNGIHYLFHRGGSWTVPPYGTTRPSCSWHSAIFVINEVS